MSPQQAIKVMSPQLAIRILMLSPCYWMLKAPDRKILVKEYCVTYAGCLPKPSGKSRIKKSVLSGNVNLLSSGTRSPKEPKIWREAETPDLHTKEFRLGM